MEFEKMTKETRLLFLVVILSLLFVFSVCTPLIPSVHATEVTSQQKGLSILGSVVGLDLTKYDVKAKEYQSSTPSSYLGVVPQTNVDYDLTSEGSKLKVLCTFANGNLQMMRVLENEGTPRLIRPAIVTNAAEMAVDFLSRYQTYTADSLYDGLKSSLEGIDAGKNTTKTAGNTQLEVSVIDSHSMFKWTYTFNSITAPSRFISLNFDHGFLQFFIDNWNLYKIGSTSVNLSKQEATTIALETARAHNWSMKLDDDTLSAANLNESNIRWTALIFDKSLEAFKPRDEDPLTLYPVWRVGVALDKWYGNMYGIEVDIWADTKEVRYVQEAWSTLTPQDGVPAANVSSQEVELLGSKTNFAMLIGLPTIASIVSGFTLIRMSQEKRALRSLLKPRSLRTGGMLLTVLISSTILLSTFASVNADLQKGGGVVWGSESTGQYPNYWRKSANEIAKQHYICPIIASDFQSNGYDGYNYQGSEGNTSMKAYILATITSLQNTYVYVAVVDFDHGIGRTDYDKAPNEWHYMMEDQVGTRVGPDKDHFIEHPENGVYDMDVYPLTGSGKISFAFINTCLSANISTSQNGWDSTQGLVGGRARGLPFAWTHRYVKFLYAPNFNVVNDISDNGYYYPDTGRQCYVAFPWGSASLEQRIPRTTGEQYFHWVNTFFWYALNTDMTVNQALDQASGQYWGGNFGNSPLRTGFQAYWSPDWWPQVDSTMAVYGNGNIRLKLYSLTVNSPVTTANVYIDNQYRGTTGHTFTVSSGSHSVRVDSSTHCFHNFTGYSEFQNPITVSVTQSKTVTANYYTNPPPQYTLSISAGQGGTTNPSPGNRQYTPRLVSVTAIPNQGYGFDHWLLDGVSHSENPVSVPMSSNHQLQAIFVSISAYVSSIYGYAGAVINPTYMVGSQPNGQYAVLASDPAYGIYGWISGTLNLKTTGHIYMYGYSQGSGHLYAYVSTNGNSWTLVGSPVVSSTSPYWIDCGTYAGSFNYVKASVTGDTVTMYIDSVKVTP
jgi:Divergent InlB B-repeat domain/PEGA domain